MNCVTPEEIEDVFQGNITGPRLEEVRRHIEQCDHCRRTLNRARAGKEDRRNLREPPLPDPAGSQPSPCASLPGYKILREIHQSEHALVYQAIQESTDRKVAIKVMNESPFSSSSDKTRFELEGRILEALDHPNVVRFVAFGEIPSGAFFCAMPYVEGVPLDQYADVCRKAADEKGQDLGDLLRLFVKIADAVDTAHQHDIVHRNLNPSNILVDGRGEPHILGFGLVRGPIAATTREPYPQPVAITEEFLSSLPWASPEQAGAIPARIDMRTDVYALGVILHRMLTGQFPYETVQAVRDVLSNILKAKPAPRVKAAKTAKAKRAARPRRRRQCLKLVNTEIESVIRTALARSPDGRHESAGRLARNIDDYLSGRPSTTATQATKSKWSRLRIVLVLAVLVGISVLLYWWVRTH